MVSLRFRTNKVIKALFCLMWAPRYNMNASETAELRMPSSLIYWSHSPGAKFFRKLSLYSYFNRSWTRIISRSSNSLFWAHLLRKLCLPSVSSGHLLLPFQLLTRIQALQIFIWSESLRIVSENQKTTQEGRWPRSRRRNDKLWRRRWKFYCLLLLKLFSFCQLPW